MGDGEKGVDVMFVCETLIPAGRLLRHEWLVAQLPARPPEGERGGRPAGGCCVLVRPEWRRMVRILNRVQEPGFEGITFRVGEMQVAGAYLLPSMPPQLIEETMEQLRSRMSSGQPAIIMGDLNARVGPAAGDVGYTMRGRRLVEWCALHRFCVTADPLGRPTRTQGTSTLILDYILMNEVAVSTATQYAHRHDMWPDSDHCPVSVVLQMTRRALDCREQHTKPPRFKVAALSGHGKEEETLRATYIKALDYGALETCIENMTRQMPGDADSDARQAVADAVHQTVVERIRAAATAAVGQVKEGPRRQPIAWSPELLALHKAMKQAHSVARRDSRDSAGGELAWTLYRMRRDEFRRRLRAAKREGYRQFVERVNEAAVPDLLRTIRLVRRSRLANAEQCPVDPGDMRSAAEACAVHFARACNVAPAEREEEDRQTLNEDRETNVAVEEGAGWTDEQQQQWEIVFLQYQVQMAQTRLPNRKAPGQDGIANELLKYEGGGMTVLLSNFFLLLARLGTTPTAWSKANIFPI